MIHKIQSSNENNDPTQCKKNYSIFSYFFFDAQDGKKYKKLPKSMVLKFIQRIFTQKSFVKLQSSFKKILEICTSIKIQSNITKSFYNFTKNFINDRNYNIKVSTDLPEF